MNLKTIFLNDKYIVIKIKINNFISVEELHFMEHFLLSTFPFDNKKQVSGYTNYNNIVLEFPPKFTDDYFTNFINLPSTEEEYLLKRAQIIKELKLEREGRSIYRFELGDYIENNSLYCHYNDEFMSLDKYKQILAEILNSEIIIECKKINMKYVDILVKKLTNLKSKLKNVKRNFNPYNEEKMLKFFNNPKNKVKVILPSSNAKKNHPKVFLLIKKDNKKILDIIKNTDSFTVYDYQDHYYLNYTIVSIAKNEIIMSFIRISNLEIKNEDYKELYNYIQNTNLMLEFCLNVTDCNYNFEASNNNTKDGFGVIEILVNKNFENFKYNKKQLDYFTGGKSDINFLNGYLYLSIWFSYLTNLITSVGFTSYMINLDKLKNDLVFHPYRCLNKFNLKIVKKKKALRVFHRASLAIIVFQTKNKKVKEEVSRYFAEGHKRIAYASYIEVFKNLEIHFYFIGDDEDDNLLIEEVDNILTKKEIFILIKKDNSYDFQDVLNYYKPQLILTDSSYIESTY